MDLEYSCEFDYVPKVREFAKKFNSDVDELTLSMIADKLAEFGYVKVTRCRDCRNRAGENEQGVDPYFCVVQWRSAEPNFFCAWGEQREEE